MFVFTGWGFCSFVSVSFLVFCPEMPRILVTGMSSGPVGILAEVCGGIGA